MKRSIIALALAAALPLSAQAGEIKYNYVEAGYNNADFLGDNGTGFYGEGSFAFNEKFYGTVSYRSATNDDLGIDVSLDETVVNLGYRMSTSDKVDFIAEVGYVNVGLDIEDIASDNADGYRVAAGFRGMLAPKFEASIKGYYTDLGGENGGGEFGARVGGVFHINQTWGIVGSFDTTELGDESINTWGLGVRASF